jgi:hypothetical protein
MRRCGDAEMRRCGDAEMRTDADEGAARRLPFINLKERPSPDLRLQTSLPTGINTAAMEQLASKKLARKSCYSCKLRKRRCTRELPQCGLCIRYAPARSRRWCAQFAIVPDGHAPIKSTGRVTSSNIHQHQKRAQASTLLQEPLKMNFLRPSSLTLSSSTTARWPYPALESLFLHGYSRSLETNSPYKPWLLSTSEQFIPGCLFSLACASMDH